MREKKFVIKPLFLFFKSKKPSFISCSLTSQFTITYLALNPTYPNTIRSLQSLKMDLKQLV